MTRRGWLLAAPTSPGHLRFSLALASSLRTSPVAKILRSKRFEIFEFDQVLVSFVNSNHVVWSSLLLLLLSLQKVPFISEDLALECEGKDKYKCGSNVFWKW